MAALQLRREYVFPLPLISGHSKAQEKSVKLTALPYSQSPWEPYSGLAKPFHSYLQPIVARGLSSLTLSPLPWVNN